MKLPKTLFLSLLFITSSYFLFAQQVMVNLEWEAATGNPSELIDYSASTFDDSGNLIVVGNTLTNGESENFLVSKFDPDGVLQWEYEYNFNDADSTDFATAVVCDQSNNIYITGGSFDDVSYSFDFATLKLDASGGFKWVERYNGADDLDDIPSAIGVDWDGNVYISGGSKTQADGWDYMTIKYDSTGSEAWTVNYDYGQLDDFASELHVEGGSGELTVVGGSASSATAWDFAVIHYDSDGNWLSTDREASGIGTFDKPMAFYQDDVGNMYITGSKSANGTDFDIMTIKLNANSQLKWTQTFDGHNMEDGAYDVIADPQGNVYIAGYTQKSNLGMNFLVLKYDSTGTLEWSKERTPYYPQDSAKATEIALDASGNVYASGYIQDQGDKDVLTMGFDPTGQYGWEKVFENPYDPEEFATDISVDLFGNAYVTAKSIDLATSSYILLSYSNHKREIVLMTDSTNNREIARNELIFRVDPQYLKMDKIDNTDIVFGTVDDFIISELRNLMADKLGLGTAMGTTPMYKLCPFLTRADTLSILANGDTVRNPNYYATFVLSLPLPLAEQEGYITAKEAVDSLMLLHPKIGYAEISSIYRPDIGANDFYYSFTGNQNQSGQYSLHNLAPWSVDYPADINVESAWDLAYSDSTNPHIRVGIIDQGTLWSHEDFRIDPNGSSSDPSNSKIKDGYDYTNGVSIFSPQSQHNSHGTAVSGIIGALRNNSVGVAGIAGGDMSNNDTGADLYDYLVLDTFGLGQTFPDFVAKAINQARVIDSVQIINLSFGDTLISITIWEAIQTAIRNQMTVVASRGNLGLQKLHFPGCFPGVIGVGATDEYGRRYAKGTTTGRITQDSGFEGSNVGQGTDLMAPGVIRMIETTVTNPNRPYSDFAGTSGAAPHVTGVGTLLMRFYANQKASVLPQSTPQKLAPEDIECLMESTAFDINGSDSPLQIFSYASKGYDIQTGYGLVDAGAALHKIKFPDFFIDHTGTSNYSSHFDSNQPFFLETEYFNSFSNQTHITGTYGSAMYQIRDTIAYTPPTGFHIDTVWARHSSSFGWSEPLTDGIFPPHPFNFNNEKHLFPTAKIYVDDFTQTQIMVSTYAYHVAWNPQNLTDSIWWPIEYNGWAGVNDPRLEVSVLLKNNLLLDLEEENKVNLFFNLFPNPASENVSINFSLSASTITSVSIFSIDGKQLINKNLGKLGIGEHEFSFSLSQLPKGLFLVRLKTESSSFHQKLIKI